jgi:hypothetical protein
MNNISFKFIARHDRFVKFAPDDEGSYSIPDQIIVLIDGKKILGKCCGMFPLDFFSQNELFYKGNLQIGICGCSAYGCGDEFIRVNSTNDTVIWEDDDGKNYLFDKKEYSKKIQASIKKYGVDDLYKKADDVILEEVNKKIFTAGITYKTFRFYDYGYDIILFFEDNKIEKEFYIRWEKDVNALRKELSMLKEDNMYVRQYYKRDNRK